MPIKSEAQRRLMYAAMKDPKGTGIPRSVAEKFVGPKAHAEGGSMKESKEMMGKELAFMKAKKAPKSMIKHEKAEAKGKGYAKGGGIESKGKTKGKMVKMAMGGKAC
jgi:acyl CoA:acetate/3-ketoacid CoA transferase alpha subunit